jgi:glycosyltransferase involved in cell wall biosynthesis
MNPDSPPRLLYVACPTSLRLASANAVQTFSTLRELRRLAPATLALVPRWGREATRFGEVGARHLLRPAIGKLSRIYPSTLWYYAERSVFAAMTAMVALLAGLLGRWYDVVYVRDTVAAFWWAVAFGPMLGLPVVYEAHDLESTNPSGAKEAWARGLVRAIDEGALRGSAHVVSLTEEFRRQLSEEGLRPPRDVTVIPDAFDEHTFKATEGAPAREALGLSREDEVVCYAGLTFAHRGLGLLVEAVAVLRAAHPRLRLFLVGGRPAEIRALREQADRLGLGEDLQLTGPRPQEEVVRYLQAADVLVIPDTVSVATASPLKLFEYLACGRAVVLPDLPALAEILPESVGYYFRRGDGAALAAALDRALRDPGRSRRESAGAAAVREHTYAARARRILAVSAAVRGGAAGASA